MKSGFSKRPPVGKRSANQEKSGFVAAPADVVSAVWALAAYVKGFLRCFVSTAVTSTENCRTTEVLGGIIVRDSR